MRCVVFEKNKAKWVIRLIIKKLQRENGQFSRKIDHPIPDLEIGLGASGHFQALAVRLWGDTLCAKTSPAKADAADGDRRAVCAGVEAK